MTNLSPAAQAVKDAAQKLYADRMARKMAWPLDLPVVAAALRAAANQVVPEQGCQIYGLTQRENERQQVREEILAIAAELEANAQ
jgi:hypothetical protein